MSLPTPPPPQPHQTPENPNPNPNTLTNNPTPIRPPPIMFPPSQRPPQNPIYQQQSRNPNPNYPQLAPRPDPSSHLRYPGSGRGFITRPAPSSRAAAINNNNNSPRRPFVFSYPEPNPLFVRQTQMPPPLLLNNHNNNNLLLPARPPAAGLNNIVPSSSQQQLQHHHQHKVAGTSVSVLESNSNGHNKHQLRDRNKDDASVTIRDRKVRLNNNGSLYSLCRSWLRNGFPEEAQLHYPDNVKALPKPLPLAVVAVNSTDKKEGDKEVGDEGEVSVEHLSSKELLQGHVKRAKRIRSRLREERHERITRYKTRLALLLPPMVDQSPVKNETN